MQSFEDPINQYKQDLMKLYEQNRGGARQAFASMDAVRPEEPATAEPEAVHPYINYGGPAESVSAPVDAANPGGEGASNANVNSMETLSPENPPLVSYAEFLEDNPKSGSLKVQAYTGSQIAPISGVTIIVSKTFTDGERVFYSLVTDENGIVDGILLPAPSKTLSEQPSNIPPYADYSVTAFHPDFHQEVYYNVPIFEGIKSIQPVRLTPSSINRG